MRPSREALLEHRATMSAYGPTLPQRAGRAFGRLRVLNERLSDYRAATAAQPKSKKGSSNRIRVFGEVNPTLDPDQIARILVNFKPRG